MSISARISRAAQTAQFWIGLAAGGAVGLLVIYASVDGRYAHADDFQEVKQVVHKNELRSVQIEAIVPVIRDDVKDIKEILRQREYRDHRLSIPDPDPLDMGAPALVPRGH